MPLKPSSFSLQYDKMIRNIFQKSLNLHLDESQSQQATFPFKHGDIRTCIASQITFPALLSYTAASSKLVSEMLPEAPQSSRGKHDPNLSNLSLWQLDGYLL